ncbi:MAG: hypothetical protein E7199_05650 [Schwartzia succinivorans]|nr:hypothetical protein [Schwartzia succinivorans]
MKVEAEEILRNLCEMKQSNLYVFCCTSEAKYFGWHGIPEGGKQPDDFDRHPEYWPKWGDRHLWASGYYVATVGTINETTIREYICNQGEEDRLEGR